MAINPIVSPQGPPNPQVPLITGPSLTITPQWYQYLVSQTSAPPASTNVPPDASPFSYTASMRGSLLVAGGTVSAIAITRGRDVIGTSMTSGVVPLSQGDIATITYTVAPTLTFLAS